MTLKEKVVIADILVKRMFSSAKENSNTLAYFCSVNYL